MELHGGVEYMASLDVTALKALSVLAEHVSPLPGAYTLLACAAPVRTEPYPRAQDVRTPFANMGMRVRTSGTTVSGIAGITMPIYRNDLWGTSRLTPP